MQNRLLIFSVFIVASCGLAYELIAGALASYCLVTLFFSFQALLGYIYSPWVLVHMFRNTFLMIAL